MLLVSQAAADNDHVKGLLSALAFYLQIPRVVPIGTLASFQGWDLNLFTLMPLDQLKPRRMLQLSFVPFLTPFLCLVGLQLPVPCLRA